MTCHPFYKTIHNVTLRFQLIVVMATGSCAMQLRPLTRCMTDGSIETSTHAFNTNRLDYRSGLFYCISDGLTNHLQAFSPECLCCLVTGLELLKHNNTCSAAAALAAGLSNSAVYVSEVHSTFAVRNCARLPVRRMLTGYVYRIAHSTLH
jgi:hypothetical protein